MSNETQRCQMSLNEGDPASPDKQMQFDYSLHQQGLEQVHSDKYFGITITDGLDWGQHISEILSTPTKIMGFLRRNLAFAHRHTKEVAYKILAHPQLEYVAPIWHPYQIGQVEKVQRTAARWTCRRWRNTSSAGGVLCELECIIICHNLADTDVSIAWHMVLRSIARSHDQ